MKSIGLGIVILVAAGAVAAENGPSSGVTFLPATTVSGAFDKGAPLIETGGYKVHASRREQPGMAEVHVRDTDILYVLKGSATIVTGGRIVDQQTTATDEIRGPAIDGGDERTLVAGDVLIVPNGVPHWFKQVSPPFLYYVVKTTAAAGERP